ncbi:protein of unknown function [Taphrina deformans PYCC 5710]|uniref:Uncharacterized protein n=1 Tax=Taphrina deformans (strain PYCC 5710 / ATCC 11124 / CBS 356.35 / IMI 108563 / JCM 9778 / NBRC 8474) TaxID=1097556 RepID=R4XF18_TAPDE|nr:protein of unknown function [Taphrina deformans PYCC 5710]|eukprot:CCG84233.1 protein of unknown function [Taphrina deformans PYCC 5710]
MVLKIRLQRFGQKKLPFYHIVCMNARTARNSKPLEKLGTYDPIPKNGNKDITLNFERTKYWLGVGAQPTETAARLLERADLIAVRPKPWHKLREQEADKSSETPGVEVASGSA